MFPALTPVASTNLAAVGYDPPSAELFVQFNNGTVYCYFNVPASVYSGLLAASSHGSFFHHFVRHGGYPYQRVA